MIFGASTAFGAHHEDSKIAPKTVIHVVTLTWKDDASDEQIKKALDGVKTIAKKFDGVTRVWTRAIKTQGDHEHAFVMEFKDEQALKDYAGSDAQKVVQGLSSSPGGAPLSTLPTNGSKPSLGWYKRFQPRSNFLPSRFFADELNEML